MGASRLLMAQHKRLGWRMTAWVQSRMGMLGSWVATMTGPLHAVAAYQAKSYVGFYKIMANGMRKVWALLAVKLMVLTASMKHLNKLKAGYMPAYALHSYLAAAMFCMVNVT